MNELSKLNHVRDCIQSRNVTRDLVLSFNKTKMQTTIEAYSQDLRVFREFLEVESVDDAAKVLLSSEQGKANYLVLQFKAYLMERGNSPNTINRRLAALRSLVKFARTIGLVTWGLEIQNLKTETYRDTAGPGIEGVKKLLDQAQGEENMGKAVRDIAIIRLLHDLALRRGEIVRLDYEDVDMARDRLFILGKGKVQKTPLSLPEATKNAIIRWLNYRGHFEGPLFTNFDRSSKGKSQRLTGRSIHRIIKKLGHEIGIDTRPHGLRHTAITEAVKKAQANDINLEEVMDYSRHRDIKVLMIYRDRERNVQGKLANLVSESI